MADPTRDEVSELIREQMASNAASAPSEDAGALESFASGLRRGATASPAAVSGMANFAGVGDPQKTEEFRSFLNRYSGQPEPDTFPGKVGERIGTGALIGAASLPGAFAAGGLPLVFHEVAANVVAPTVGQLAEEMGAPPLVQAGAEMISGGLIPSPRSVPRVVSVGARQGADGAARIAEELGTSPLAVRRMQKHWTDQLPIDPDTGLANKPEVIKRLRRAAQAPKNRRVTTAQAAGKEGGSRLMKAEAAAVRNDQDFERFNAGRQLAVEKYLESNFQKIRPKGNIEDVRRVATTLRDNVYSRTQQLWKSAPLEEIPEVSVSSGKKAAMLVTGRTPNMKKRAPSDAIDIAALPDKIPASELHEVTSALLAKVREYGRPTSSGAERVAAQRLRPVIDGLLEDIKKMPGSGSDAYRAARASTAEFYAMFPDESKIVSGMLELEDASAMAKRLTGLQKNIQKEVDSAFRILDQSPGGRESLKAVLIDELHDGDLGNRSVRTVKKELRRKEKVYRAVLGDDGYKEQMRIAQDWLDATSFVTANQGTYARTGSGLNKSAVPGLIQNMRKLGTVSGAIDATAGVVDRFLLMMDDARFGRELMREFQLNPKVAADILEVQDPKNIERFVTALDQVVSGVIARRRVLASGAVRSLGQPDVGMSVDADLPEERGQQPQQINQDALNQMNNQRQR